MKEYFIMNEQHYLYLKVIINSFQIKNINSLYVFQNIKCIRNQFVVSVIEAMELLLSGDIRHELLRLADSNGSREVHVTATDQSFF